MTRVLVAYATRNGSTRGVADTVALAEGAEVVVTDVRSALARLDGWDLVILGAPIYSGHWQAAAHRFLKRHRDELSCVPVAVFGLGPRSDDEEAWRRSWAQLHRALDKRKWLVPVAVGLFGGADPLRRRPGPRRDLRDSTEIGQWARKAVAMSATAVAIDATTPGPHDRERGQGRPRGR